ncbi:hypothetical protein [Niallia sp. NCCP-28]|uniref:hypothetical protein n=1 Tax=Niallia sp. NCCP-28 TaxID=2934712 RepID=UPI002085D12C|nr:hypothetical protein [Niallia sp. NCCP-28]GKU80931.1 hypothetical protein NCCP28_03270 [Niallia sp. NCCP-28]
MKREDMEAIISACDYDRKGQIIGLQFEEREKVFWLLLNEWTSTEMLISLKIIENLGQQTLGRLALI